MQEIKGRNLIYFCSCGDYYKGERSMLPNLLQNLMFAHPKDTGAGMLAKRDQMSEFHSFLRGTSPCRNLSRERGVGSTKIGEGDFKFN